MDVRKKKNYSIRRALFRLVAILSLGLLAAGFWRWSPVREWSDPSELGTLLRALDASPYAGPIVVAAYVLGSLVVFPVTVLIAATGIALGPTSGAIWASVASLVSACLNYCFVRCLPTGTVERVIGPWIYKLGKRFDHGGIVAIMFARYFPFAPFTVVNVVAGAARIRFADFLTGTVLGMGPIILALTLFGDRLRGAWEAPTVGNVSMMVLAALLWIAIAMSLQSLSNRRYASHQEVESIQ